MKQKIALYRLQKEQEQARQAALTELMKPSPILQPPPSKVSRDPVSDFFAMFFSEGYMRHAPRL